MSIRTFPPHLGQRYSPAGSGVRNGGRGATSTRAMFPPPGGGRLKLGESLEAIANQVRARLGEHETRQVRNHPARQSDHTVRQPVRPSGPYQSVQAFR